MDKDELAKLILVEDVKPEFIDIYEMTGGFINSKEDEKNIENYIQKTSYNYLQILKRESIVTADFRFDRLNVVIDDSCKIIKIYVG